MRVAYRGKPAAIRGGLAACAALLVAGVGLLPRQADAVDMVQLLDRADAIYRGKTAAAVVVMDIKTKSYQRQYNLLVWDEKHEQERTLVKILGPSLWRGYSMLKIGPQLKVYDPKSDHVTVVGQTMLDERWMGSHFTHDDLVRETQLASHYHIKALKTWTASGPTGQPATFHRLELTPRPTAPVVWGRIVYDLCQIGADVLPIEAVYYKDQRSTEPVRTMKFNGVQRFGPRLVPAVVTLAPAAHPGESTTIRYETLRFDVKIPDAKFTEQALRK